MTELAAASRAGLSLDVHEDEDGTYSALLTDASGRAVWQKDGYRNFKSAKASATWFINQHYKRGRQASPSMSSAGGKALLRQLRTQAQENEKEAARLAETSDLLYQEAKRLTAAADVLEASYE